MSRGKNNERSKERERERKQMFVEVVKNRKSRRGERLKGTKRRCHKDAPVVKGTSVFVGRKILIPSPTTRPGAFISFAVIF